MFGYVGQQDDADYLQQKLEAFNCEVVEFELDPYGNESTVRLSEKILSEQGGGLNSSKRGSIKND